MEYKYDPILCMNIPVGKSKVKDVRTVDEEVNFREIQMAAKQAKVGKVEVFVDDFAEVVKGFSVNWPGIGNVSPSEAISFANDIIKAAKNAAKLESKYKGAKEVY